MTEERLGLVLLAPERREGIVALVGEGGEEHEGDGTLHRRRSTPASYCKLQREVRIREEQLAEDAGEQEDEQERDEPADGPAHLEEDQRPEGSQDARESDRRRKGGNRPRHRPPAIGATRMSRSCTRRRNRKFLIRANTTKDATEIAQ